MNTSTSIYLAVLLPAIFLSAMALIVMLLDSFYPESFLGIRTRIVTAALALLGFGAAGFVAALAWNDDTMDASGMLHLDHFTAFLTVVFCLGGILTVLLSARLLEHAGAGEYYALLLFAVTGAYFMAAANHLIIVFLGLEVLSVAVYPLAGFMRRDPRSNEAALKYFLLGAFSSAFLLYGIALLYGASGMAQAEGRLGVAPGWSLGLLRFDQLSAYVLSQPAHSPIFWGGVALIVVGFCFKAALAPFHMWTPDVYDGSPTPVTAFMSAVVKAAAFAPFFRFFLEVLGRARGESGEFTTYGHWGLFLMAVCVLTMTWGNLAAVAEPSIKRMLAYSSVAHAGYITVALISENRASLLFYSLVYTLMVMGSFGCVALVRRKSGEEALQIREWTGLGLRYPVIGVAMSLFLFALAGFPPTAGFMGKFYIFRAALETGADMPHQNGYVALVAIALVNSLISVYYYLRVVMAMYRPAADGADEVVIHNDTMASTAIAIAALGILVLGLYPQIVIGPLERAFPL